MEAARISVELGGFHIYNKVICPLLIFTLVVFYAEVSITPLLCFVDNVSNLTIHCENGTLHSGRINEIGYDIPRPEYKNPPKTSEILAVLAMGYSVCLYMPYIMWYLYGKTKLKMLVSFFEDLDSPLNLRQKVRALALGLLGSGTWQRSFMLAYFFCELTAFFTILTMMQLTNSLLNEYTIQLGLLERIKNMYWPFLLGSELLINFPDTATCTYADNGKSVVALCELPVNKFYRALLMSLWGAEVLLFVATVFSLLYRIISLLSIHVRIISLQFGLNEDQKRQVKIITPKVGYEFWFTLILFKKNMNSVAFNFLLDFLVDLLQQ